MKLSYCSIILVAAILLTAAAIPVWRSADASAMAGKVVPTGNMTLARSGHTATRLPDGRVLVAGGMVRNGEFLADCELYDPATGRFASGRKMASQRVSHSATLLPNGKVLIAGGIAGRYRKDGHWMGLALATAELYDPAAAAFATTGSMSEARNAHGAVLLPTGKVLVVGGAGDGDWREPSASAELYDPATGRFTPTGAMHTPRIPDVTLLLRNGDVLVVGGTGPGGSILASAEIYHTATGEFSPAGALQLARHKHAGVALRDGRVLVVGGSDERDWHGQTRLAEIYDPVQATSSVICPMASERFKLARAVVLLRDGRVLVAGGSERAEIYDPSGRFFRAVEGSLEAPWHFSTATLLTDGRVLIVGGYPNNSEATARAWLYVP